MWDPDNEEKENVQTIIPSREELFEALQQSEHAREYYGLRKLENGRVEVSDLPKIQSFPEEVKAMLRDFLKTYGGAPQAMPVSHPLGMTPTTRQRLDELYAKLNRLANTPPRKYFKENA